MTRRLLIECGAADTRAALIENDEAIAFWFGPARGDESLPRPPAPGDIVLGRARAISKSLNAAFVDIGADRDAFLPLAKGEKPPTEGERMIARVRRPPLGEKGAVLALDWATACDEARRARIEAAAREAAPGLLVAPEDAALAACALVAGSAPGLAGIVVSEPDAMRALKARGLDAATAASPFGDEGVEEAIAEALESVIALPGGARLHIHETEAGALIDVDSASASEGAPARMNDRINLETARRLPGEISRRRIGGRLIVDFLPPSNAAARADIAAELKTGLRLIAGARLGAVAPDGLCDMTTPRLARSLLAEASETAGAGWLVPGRRFTLDWSAKSAIRALERELRARPSSRPKLLAGREIADYLELARPQWARRLAEKFGARFSIGADETLESRNYDVA